MVLQDTALDRGGAFRSRTLPPCTVWPRTVMRGKLRKGNSGHNSLPKPARRTEPYPRFAAQPKGVAAQRRVWGSQEGEREPYGALFPFCPRRRAAALPRHVMANIPGPGRACLACGGKPPERRNRSPSTEGKNHGAPPTRRKVCPLLPIRLLRIYKAFYKGFS